MKFPAFIRVFHWILILVTAVMNTPSHLFIKIYLLRAVARKKDLASPKLSVRPSVYVRMNRTRWIFLEVHICDA